MLVQALAEYADHYLSAQLNDSAWEEKPVPWSLDISRQGTFSGVVPRMTPVTRGKKQVDIPMRMSVARSPVNRNSGEHPLLGTDDIAYVLGAGSWTPDKAADKEKAAKHHEAFVALLQRAAAKTGDEALAACARFYGSPEEVEKARTALHEAKAGALVALSVGGALVERAAVQAFWRKHYEDAFGERMEGSLGECLISGKLGAIAPTHEKIKGVSSLGGQASGVALMSFDKEAFRSYGWERNQNSPVSPDRAMAYVLALNDLLKTDNAARVGKGRRKDVAGIGFVTWLRNAEDFDALDIMEQADPKDVETLLSFDPRANPDQNQFYLLGVSGNGGRLRVEYWITESLALVKANLRNWHQQLRIDYPWEALPVARWQLDYVLDRDGDPAKHDVIALMRRGIEGPSRPLGYSILAVALDRLRHPEDTPEKKESKSGPLSLQRLRVPMSLIRMCVNDIDRTNPQEGSNEMREELDEECKLPAYVCGRLLAVFEDLQLASVRADNKKRQPEATKPSGERGINLTVTDRYFSLASANPQVAFPKIEDLAQKHMRKLRRDSPGTARRIEELIVELHEQLDANAKEPFPSVMGLVDQGRFVLGYYQQKAKFTKQRLEAIARKQQNTGATTDILEDDSEEEK